GLVGFGRLGKEMARFGAAFRMDVVAWSRSLTDAQAAEHGATRAASLDDLLTTSDFVSVHLPQTAETVGLIDARALAAMKASAYLVNTARGPIVDEAALIDALTRGTIRGAALDVYDTEPLPAEHPFRTLGNVVAVPHLGYVTEETYRSYFTGVVEAISGWLDGAPVRVLTA
ncbi:MAG: NAD(P)-dependent oxidoreductase, partial [Jannaschia sp.]